MKKTTSAVAALLLVGFTAAAVVLIGPEPLVDVGPIPDPAVYFDANAATDERIRALEIAVGEERNARQLLEEELGFILDELDRINADERQTSGERSEDNRGGRDAAEIRESFQQRRNERFSTEGRTQQLVDAGLSPDRAALIVQREAELQMEALQARFDARQSGDRLEPGSIGANPEAALRAEIGDTDYAMYLEANNRSTSVGISSVIPSSPAQTAGLQPGDRIVSYGGERVFSTNDLNAQTIQGTPGQNVLVEIERDGVPMQFVLPRGPLGISGGRRQQAGGAPTR
jgi:hypothetical protein